MLEHTIVIDCDRHDVESATQRWIASDANHVVEQTDLRFAELSVATQSTLEKDSLRDAVARDQLDVSLEDGVIESLPIFSANEIRAEGFEDVFERKCARPFADGV